MNNPQVLRKVEKAQRELLQLLAEIDTQTEEERRTRQPGRRNWQG